MKLAKTLGELKTGGYKPRRVKSELRENLIAGLRQRRNLFPGVIGYQDTVIPQMIHAILAEHNILLLGLRGQAKTRLIRCLVDMLDDAVPVIADAPLHEDPMNPITPTGRELVETYGDDLPIEWLARADRYNEKLATPDVNIADLIGDLDPIKAMNKKLDFASEEAIHYGLIPRSNRGIFAINELPDLQPRIQVGLFNILEERDFQVRGFPIRMNIDIAMVFTANPEDYTNRGNIITPLKDRIESQIMTHYPANLAEGVAIVKQEAWAGREDSIELRVSDLFYDLVEQVAIEARNSDYVDRNSGVSARMPISLLEIVHSAMERRAFANGDKVGYARVCDLFQALPAITGKVELVYKGEQEGLAQVAEHLVGKAIKERFGEIFIPGYKRGADLRRGGLEIFADTVNWFESGANVELDETMSWKASCEQLSRVPGLRAHVAERLPKLKEPEQFGAMEFMLEGLAQNFAISKYKLRTGTRYADELSAAGVED